MKKHLSTPIRGLLSFVFLLFLFGFTANPVRAQKDKWGVELNGGAYRLHKHRADIMLDESYFPSFDVSLFRQSQADEIWAQNNFLPRVGLQYSYSHFSDEAMGRAHGLLIWAGNDVWKRRIFWRGGFGLGYLTKTLDLLENPRQTAISTSVNVYFDARIGYSMRLMDRHSVELSAVFYHFSNAATRLPNSGMNFLGISLGTSFNRYQEKIKPERHLPDENRHEIQLIGLGAIRQPVRSYPVYGIGNMALEYNYRLKPNYRIGLGATIFYEASEKKYERWAGIWGDGNHQSYAWHELLSSGLYLNNEWVFDRLSAFLHIGAYTHGSNRRLETSIAYEPGEEPYTHHITLVRNTIFNRIGFRYRLTDKLMINLSMKTNFAKARYSEFGLGWRLF